jgi:hypothetical protein
MAAYCEHNGYIFKHIDPAMSDPEPGDHRWGKVKLLIDALDPVNGWARNLDYIMWVDADLVIVDPSLRLEAVAAAHPHANVLVSAEHAGSSTLINSGAILVRNRAWTRKFLHAWWTLAHRRLYSDQEQFDLLYNLPQSKAEALSFAGLTSSPDSQAVPWIYSQAARERYIAILPPTVLNTDPPAMTQVLGTKAKTSLYFFLSQSPPFPPRTYVAFAQQPPCVPLSLTLPPWALQWLPENQVLHLMGEHTAFRARVFRAAAEALCLSYRTGRPAEPQLGLDRDSLLRWTIDEYRPEVAEVCLPCHIVPLEHDMILCLRLCLFLIVLCCLLPT